MKAVTPYAYGGPDVLRLVELELPSMGEHEVLIRIHGAAVNPGDWDFMRGTPFILRPSTGIRRPKAGLLGLAVAGVVDAVGDGVTTLSAGDEVYAGLGGGGFAEYAVASADSCALKPTSLSFEEAAAVPVAGTTALQALRDVAGLQSDQSLLVNGASGGVGSFAVQIGKSCGAEVTGVCSSRNAALVRSIGADHVVDYTTEDFSRTGKRYDVVLDNVGNRSLGDYRRALTPKGVFIPNSNKGTGRWLGGYVRRALAALALSPFVRQKLRPFAATERSNDLATLAGLVDSGQIVPVIDRTYPLDELADALERYGTGRTRGKLVVTIGAEQRQ